MQNLNSKQITSKDNLRFEMMEQDPIGYFSLDWFWEKLVNENKLKRVFYDDSIKNMQDFTNFVNHYTWFFFAYKGSSLVGGVWFTHFLGKSCKMHICSFRGYKASEWYEPASELLNFILDNPTFKCYKIIVESPYSGIKRLIKAYGFVENNDQLVRFKI